MIELATATLEAEAPLPEIPQEDERIFLSDFAQKIYTDKYAWKNQDGEPVEVWPDTAYRVTKHVMGALGYHPGSEEFEQVFSLIYERKFIPGGRYLYSTGRELHQTQNCALFRADDSREGWADLLSKCAMALQTGAGIGVVYSDIREKGAPIRKTGGIASGPLSLMNMINEIGRHIVQGGTRRSAIWAGLHWNHPDVFDFIYAKDWPQEIKDLKNPDKGGRFDFPADLDTTNISVILDTAFFEAFNDEDHEQHELAKRVYHETVAQMVKTAEPGFSVDAFEHEGENLRNACTEITSSEDSDICNLGSVNMGRIETLEEFRQAVHYGTLFLLAGTEYSDVPTDKIREVREKNRRLGLGLMGIHAWLLKRGERYGMTPELREWLEVYRDESDEAAVYYALLHNLALPVGRRAIAPNGSISYIGETTSSGEPIPFVAYKRTFIEGRDTYQYTYVIDPTAKLLIDEYGVEPDKIEDSHVLAYNYERRIKFQAELQEYVDHAISSTVNLPYPITEEQELQTFEDTLMKYLPRLRGITCYPNGARSGQPFIPVDYDFARQHEGTIYEGDEETCVGGVCGM
jgi:ribonucleoside-diphosphate reductase alpha chain